MLPDNRYCVKSSDICRWPIDQKALSQQDYYYLDSLFQDALQQISRTTYESLDEAIMKHDQEFSD
jgi:hypothetical protein